MVSEIRESNLKDLIFWLLRWRRRVRVVGHSMQPLLQPGDEVLVDINAYRRSPPSPGDIVILAHPIQENLELIKRVITVDSEGDCIVQGDNQDASIDSRRFGWVKAKLIQGQVVCRF